MPNANLSRTLSAFLVALLLGLSLPVLNPAAAASDYPLDDTDDVIGDAVDYLLDEQDSDGNIGAFAISAWVVMAFAAADIDPCGCAVASGDSIVDYLEAEADSFVDEDVGTDVARMILAIVAAGEDPEDFGGVDYVDALEDLYETDSDTGYLQIDEPDMLNDDFWGVLALVAADESVDPDIIDFIYANQDSDGGWSWAIGDDSDVDDTSAAVLALIAAGEDENSDEIQDALGFLADVQNSDGGFPQYEGDESNSASDAWAIMAIEAAGGDPNGGEWEKGGDTPVDHLLSLQDSDGYFEWEEGDDTNSIWNTAYAIPALLGKPYPVSATSSGGSDDDAEIAYSPSDFDFMATEDGDAPLDRILEVWNDGDGDLDWEVDSDESWLSLSPTSGSSSGEDDEIEVSVDPAGLSAGEYDATITITADGADNSPVEIDVSLEIVEEESDTYVVAFPTDLEFTAEENGSDPDEQVIEVWNGGPGSMDWEAESDEDWLDVSPDDGSSDGEHTAIIVSVDIDDLDADDYQGTITITSDDADNSPIEIDVDLEVEESASSDDDPEIGFSPDEIEFEAEEGGSDPDDEILEIWNDGDGELEWSVTSNRDWLSLSPDDGTSTGEDDEVEVSVDIDDLDEGEYTARIIITASGAASETVDVTLTIEGDDDDGGDAGGGDQLLIIRTNPIPRGAGTVSPSVSPGPTGYEAGTVVELTAVASPGYAFSGWSGDAAGSENPVSVTVSTPLNVTAHFVRFDAAAAPNVTLTYASPDMAVVSVVPYPVQSIPSSPKGFKLLRAYVVDPQGTGSFTLRFDGLTDAENIGVFKVTGGGWTQVPRAVIGTTALEVTLPAQDPVIALAKAGAGLGIMNQVRGLFGDVDPVVLAIIGAAVFLVVVVIVALFSVRRRGGDYYY